MDLTPALAPESGAGSGREGMGAAPAPASRSHAQTTAATCWVVSDGRRGIENQALGLAEAVARRTPLQVVVKTVERPGLVEHALSRTPFAQRAPLELPDDAPDVWIGCGRAAVLQARADRAAFGARTFFVCVQDPRRNHKLFDLIVPPAHDGLTGPTVTPILGAPNRITPQKLAEAKAAFRERLSPLPKPRVAVLIGGRSKRAPFSDAVVRRVVAAIQVLAMDGVGVMITTSRRTPEAVITALKGLAEDNDAIALWTGEADGPNPYLGYLAWADAAVVTGDSTNLMTDAATAGLPILMIPVDGRPGKFALLHQALEDQGRLRRFDGRLETWDVAPLTETDRAADAVLARWRTANAAPAS